MPGGKSSSQGQIIANTQSIHMFRGKAIDQVCCDEEVLALKVNRGSGKHKVIGMREGAEALLLQWSCSDQTVTVLNGLRLFVKVWGALQQPHIKHKAPVDEIPAAI